MTLLQWKMPSPVGPIYLVASEKGLRAALFEAQAVPFAPTLEGSDPALKHLRQAAAELGEYFAGERQDFSVTLDVDGTAFQRKVWQALQEIPYGATCSYKDIARRLNQAQATRAVGNANGRNPVCIIVPCHRVIAANGALGGYSSGLPIKVKLLELEKNQRPSRGELVA